jgi:hypothetical protein
VTLAAVRIAATTVGNADFASVRGRDLPEAERAGGSFVF